MIFESPFWHKPVCGSVIQLQASLSKAKSTQGHSYLGNWIMDHRMLLHFYHKACDEERGTRLRVMRRRQRLVQLCPVCSCSVQQTIRILFCTIPGVSRKLCFAFPRQLLLTQQFVKVLCTYINSAVVLLSLELFPSCILQISFTTWNCLGITPVVSFDVTFIELRGPEKATRSFERQEARKLCNRLLIVIPVVKWLRDNISGSPGLIFLFFLCI